MECFHSCKALLKSELNPSEFETVEELLLAFGEEALQRSTSRQFFRLVMFFGEKALSDPDLMAIQAEITELYQNELANLMLMVSPNLDRESVLEVVAFLLIVNQGIASHRVIFKDKERMRKLWPVSVEAALRMLESGSSTV